MTKDGVPVPPLPVGEKCISLPEVAVRLILGAKVGGDSEQRQIFIESEGEVLQMHLEDFETAKRVADQVVPQIPKKITPGTVIRAMTLAFRHVAEQVFAPGVVRVVFYASISPASAFYRCIVPSAALSMGTRFHSSVSRTRIAREALAFDVVVIQLDTSPATEQFVKVLQSMGKRVVFEIDDAFDCLEPWHPLAEQYGKPEVRDQVRNMIRLADAVTVTTPALRDHYKSLNRNIHVIPNFIPLGDWPKSKPHGTDEFRVLWSGSPSHWGDLSMVADSLTAFARENSNVKLIFFGQRPPKLDVPEDRVVHLPFVDYKDYPDKLASISADVAIAPLADVPFNRYKSPVKLIEYAAVGYPIIASDVGPYHDCVEHLSERPFFMASTPSEWVAALDSLYASAAMRNEYIARACEWVRRYDLAVGAFAVEEIFLKVAGREA
jgi:glycosyltransferase involved in cell wall biosynthesis